ncbi:alpha/beta hydrolase [Undibacterium sp. TJN19]|uniref:alpha/beta hydrolase n=1 Tax=Undibacterium sp. TJN19 TaxID=3413055 RepID=UPI003BF0EE3E
MNYLQVVQVIVRTPHPRQADELAWTSIDRTAVANGFSLVELVAPRPLLMIVGTEAVSKWMGEDAIARANQPKELFWVDGATHVGLYYKPEYVNPAVAKLANFFNTTIL